MFWFHQSDTGAILHEIKFSYILKPIFASIDKTYDIET